MTRLLITRWCAIVFLGLDVGLWVAAATQHVTLGGVGYDQAMYVGATSRWMAGGGFFEAYQLAGPYQVWTADPMPLLYPPIALPLFAAFTVLPRFLWWAIPILVIATVVARQRPTGAQWALVAGLAAFPSTVVILTVGNPVLWVAAAVALATVFPVFGPLALIKPSVGPVALVGITRRSWWIGLGLVVVVGIPFGPLWLDWLTALGNSRQPAGLLYSLPNVPLLLLPLVAAPRARPWTTWRRS
jgi:hypothetical protein